MKIVKIVFLFYGKGFMSLADLGKMTYKKPKEGSEIKDIFKNKGKFIK